MIKPKNCKYCDKLILNNLRDKNFCNQKCYLTYWRITNRGKVREYTAKRSLSAKSINELDRYIKRTEKIVSILGCTVQELKSHLESKFKEGMTWENHSFKGWHIDHIRPCASFDLTDPEQQKQCFHYTNLQPLWWRENLIKNGTWNPKSNLTLEELILKK